MSLYTLFFTTLIIGKYGFLSASTFTPCKVDDQVCYDDTINALYQQIMAGVPSIGIEPHEPLFHELIDSNLSIIQTKYYNSTFKGLDKCKISNVKVDIQASKMHFDMFCPEIRFSGKYNINGRLVILPIEGQGDYEVKTGEYKINIDCDFKFNENDGKKYLYIKNYKLKITPLTAIHFKFYNLFNGQKDLSDAVHKYANENWKDVADLVQDPIWYAHAKKIFSSMNKLLKTVPFDEISSS